MDWTLMKFRDSVRQSGITEGHVFAQTADCESIPVVCPLQFHESFYRDKVRISKGISFGQFQLQSFSSSSGEDRPVISRQRRRKARRGRGKDSRRMGNHFGNYHPLRIVFFCHSRLLFADIVFIIGLKPSARLRARLSSARSVV